MSDSDNFDPSATWEDFFGTSIDEFMPTLLSMYDTLLLNTKQEASTSQHFQVHHTNNNYHHRRTTETEADTDTSTTSVVLSTSATCNKKTLEPESIYKCNNILHKFEQNYCDKSATLNCYNCDINNTKQCDIYKKSVIISPNVQRMLSHLDTSNNNSNYYNQNILPTAVFTSQYFKSKMEQFKNINNPPDNVELSRPLSVSSVVSNSSSSSSSSASFSSALNKCGTNNAYLASVESLDDDDNDSEDDVQSCSTTMSQQMNDDSATRYGDDVMSASMMSDDVHSTQDESITLDHHHNQDLVTSSPISRQQNSLTQTLSAPTHRPRYCDPHLNPVDRVLLEIVDTEAVYVQDLQEVIEGYLNYWINNEECPFYSNLPDLFSNIKDIHKFNENFLEQLQSCGLDPVNISNTFIRNNNGFEVYTQYCTNYPKTMSVLAELMSNESTAKIFRDQQLHLGHSLPLGSYLLKPVQRILKYHLLLQNLMKNCNIQDINEINNALQTMTGIAKHINDMKRKHEHAVRVQEIQSLLYGWMGEDLTTFGELCAEGTFRVHGAKAKRQAFLFDKMLLLTKNKEDGILNYKTHIMCSNLMLIESVRGDPLSFHVIPFDNPRLQCTLQAKNLEQKREWTLQLKRVILENYAAVIPSHARQLVMELGQQRLDDEIISDKNTNKKQYSAPEYLQRRKMDRERRKSETNLRNKLRRPRNSDSFVSPDINESDSCTSRRDKQRSESTSRERSKSRDTFVKFGSWRRKSEPGAEVAFFGNTASDQSINNKDESQLISPESLLDIRISQYNTKTIPQKIYKLKKARSKLNGSKFYTDLEASSCDNVLHISESNDSLNSGVEISNHLLPDSSVDSQLASTESISPTKKQEYVETLEDIVSQLLMQNREFQKVLKKHKQQIGIRNRVNRLSPNQPKKVKSLHSSDSESELPRISVNDSGEYETLLHDNLTAATTVTPNDKLNIQPTIPTNDLGKNKQMDATKAEESDYVLLSFNNEYVNNYTNCLNNMALPEDKTSENNSSCDPEANLKNSEAKPKDVKYEQLNRVWKMLTSSKDKKAVWYANDKPESNPITPEVWLKQQTEYLANSTNKKSGSLPRSFEFLSENNGELKYLTRSGKPLHVDRPLTIASESTNDLDFNEMENFCLHESTTSDNIEPSDTIQNDLKSENSPNPVNEPIYDVPNCKESDKVIPPSIHPEYKIYRPTINLPSLKNVLNKNSKKQNDSEISDDDKEKKHATTIVRNYSRSLMQRFKSLLNEENTIGDDIKEDSSPAISCVDSIPQIKNIVPEAPIKLNNVDTKNVEPEQTSKVKCKSLPVYKQGSKSLGARIALSDYANPNDIFSEKVPENILINKCSLRPDSVFSFSSHFTSSSDSCNCEQSEDVPGTNESDCYYEKSFEQTENLQDDSTLFRDSAVYSDPDENGNDETEEHVKTEQLSTTKISDINKQISIKKHKKLPPPIPAKPDVSKLNLPLQSNLNIELTKSIYKTTHTTIVQKVEVNKLKSIKSTNENQNDSKLHFPGNKYSTHVKKQNLPVITNKPVIRTSRSKVQHKVCAFQEFSTNNSISKMNFGKTTNTISNGNNETEIKKIDFHFPTNNLDNDHIITEDGIPATKGWVKHIVNKFQ